MNVNCRKLSVFTSCDKILTSSSTERLKVGDKLVSLHGYIGIIINENLKLNYLSFSA